jgi:SecD/SecF fusion protein
MKNKGGVVLLMIAFLGISAYFLFRTWKVNQIRDRADAFAMQADGNIDRNVKQRYLDSLAFNNVRRFNKAGAWFRS